MGRSGQDAGLVLVRVKCTLKSLDDKSGGGGNNIDLCLSVLDRELDGHP